MIAAGTVVSGAEILRPGWLRSRIGSRRLVVVSLRKAPLILEEVDRAWFR